MNAEYILAGMVIIPVVIILAFRINAAIVFLSLCLGDVLVQFVAPDAHQFLTLFSAEVPKGLDSGNGSIKILLLLLPVVLTAIFMVRTVSGYPKLLLNVLPAIGVGLLGTLLLTPLLPASASQSLIDTNLWQHLKDAQDIIVSTSALVCLLVLWLQRPHAGLLRGKHKKH
ncbi:MAG TPA: hypothetical protein VL989_02090 [Candidatus Sulfotelmatobacter sp.]|nr:hypothetical protein [Candidatus Sulfotelmatobacter sp.]